jgi:hypothetical protein
MEIHLRPSTKFGCTDNFSLQLSLLSGCEDFGKKVLDNAFLPHITSREYVNRLTMFLKSM